MISRLKRLKEVVNDILIDDHCKEINPFIDYLVDKIQEFSK
jgi:carbamoylphosphate synthase large subunit